MKSKWPAKEHGQSPDDHSIKLPSVFFLVLNYMLTSMLLKVLTFVRLPSATCKLLQARLPLLPRYTWTVPCGTYAGMTASHAEAFGQAVAFLSIPSLRGWYPYLYLD